jgi:hypothetical protein
MLLPLSTYRAAPLTAKDALFIFLSSSILGPLVRHAGEVIMENLNSCLLLLGSPSIFILCTFVVVHTLENVRTSNQNWSVKTYKRLLK